MTILCYYEVHLSPSSGLRSCPRPLAGRCPEPWRRRWTRRTKLSESPPTSARRKRPMNGADSPASSIVNAFWTCSGLVENSSARVSKIWVAVTVDQSDPTREVNRGYLLLFSREGGSPDWVPAFAGKQAWRGRIRPHPPSSSPRRRGSINSTARASIAPSASMGSRLRGNDGRGRCSDLSCHERAGKRVR